MYLMLDLMLDVCIISRFDVNPKAINQIIFAKYLDWAEKMFFIIKVVQKNVFNYSQGTENVL